MEDHSIKGEQDMFANINTFSERAYAIYAKAIIDYHLIDDIHLATVQPYNATGLTDLFCKKCWIDTIQWHVEDEIRNPVIEAEYALSLKRRIDQLNQERTNIVELIDDVILKECSKVKLKSDARLSTESPGWALDRLSILALKIFHMDIESKRQGSGDIKIAGCITKLEVLNMQKEDLMLSINQLLDDIFRGIKMMKLYKQMKMYNDPGLNPVLYRDHSVITPG